MWSLLSSGTVSCLLGLLGSPSSLTPSPPPAWSLLSTLLPESKQKPPNWPPRVHSCSRTQQPKVLFENHKCNHVIRPPTSFNPLTASHNA